MLANLRKVFALLDQKDRPKVIAVVLLMIVAAFAQTAGVASIMPFLAVLADPQIIHSNRWLSWAYESFGFQSDNAFLYVLGIAAFIVFVTGTALQALTHWVITRFSSMQQYHLSRRLMEDYLRRPYTFFLTRNSGDLSKTVLQETWQAINGGLMPILRLTSFSLLAISVIVLLVVAEPQLAITVAVALGGAYGLIYLIAGKWLTNMGKGRVKANRERFTAAAEAFAGSKEIRLLGRERDFLERYREPSRRMANYQANTTIIENVPLYAIEAVAFGGALLVVLYLMGEGGIAHALPLIGLYALAGKQLIPAFQKIFAMAASIRFNFPAVEAVLSDMGQRNGSVTLRGADEKYTPMYPKASIVMEGVSFHYPDSDDAALDNLDLVIPANTTTGIVGPSGSGKSSLIDVILGLLEPAQGRIMIDHTLLTADNVRNWQAAIGYVPQQIFLSDASIADNIALGVPADEMDREAVERAAKLANLHDFVVQDLPEAYDTLVGERGVRLSGGQRQRIGIARALYREPEVLIFDEATSALDNATERVVMEAIHKLTGTKTILLVAHRLSTVKPSDQIIVLNRGRAVEQGTWAELSDNGVVFQQLATTM